MPTTPAVREGVGCRQKRCALRFASRLRSCRVRRGASTSATAFATARPLHAAAQLLAPAKRGGLRINNGRVIRSAACDDDAFAEASEGWWSVGAAFDDFDLGDDSVGVAVGGGLVEVRQELGLRLGEAVRERVEGGETGMVDGGVELLEALLSVCSAAGAVDRSERLLQTPRLSEHRVAFEQRTELTALVLAEAL